MTSAFYRPLVKLCGIRRAEDIELINQAKPDFAGFILAEGRKRTVSVEELVKLSAMLSAEIRRVAVFLDQDREWIAAVSRKNAFDIIQLHGSETDEDIIWLQEHTKKQIIKAFRIESKEDLRNAVASKADMILLDSGVGGTGESFDWSLLSGVKRPFFLAGGLDPENVRDAIELVSPYAVDVSSGVETDYKKDKEKISRFMAAVRGE